MFQAKALAPVDLDRLDDLDTFDDVLGEIDESVAAGQPGAEGAVGSSAPRSSRYNSPEPTPTRSSTDTRPSRPRTRSYSR